MTDWWDLTEEERDARRAERRATQAAIERSYLLADPVYVAACSDNGWGTDVFHAIDIDDEPLNFGNPVDDDDELDAEAWKEHRPGRLAWTPMCGRARVWLLEPPEDWDRDGPIVDGRRHLRHCDRCAIAVHRRAVGRAALLARS